MSQLDRANALARARDEGEREGVIAAMAECAAIAYRIGPHSMGEGYSAHEVGDAIVLELRRRYGADDPRVVHHCRMRGVP